MEIIGYITAIFIGISLGLVGSGGSIITVPVLVYLFGINPSLATTYSLFVVGITALAGSIKQYKLGNLDIQQALWFAIPSVILVVLVRLFVLPLVPSIINIAGYSINKNLLLMLAFAVLMLFASTAMIKTSSKKYQTNAASMSSNSQLFLMGLIVGIVTGFLGAGGGFLIIPSLVLAAKMPIKKAIGTSLFIIFLNAFIGFTTDMWHGIAVNFHFLLAVTAVALVGLLIGTYLHTKISNEKLKPLFGWFVLLVGLYIIIKEFF